MNPPRAIAALVLLNGTAFHHRLLAAVWPQKVPVICADGAANLLHGTASDRKPTHIIGDLDSILPHIQSHYKAQGTRIIKDESQDLNDFQKAMRIAMQQPSPDPIIVMGGHGGRFDQTLGNLNTLFSTAEVGRVVTWLDATNAITALPVGTHHIYVDPSVEGPICGLIPIGRTVQRVRTEGLKWNVDGPMSFGKDGLISTSNEFREELVVIECSDPLIFTVQLRLNDEPS